jgi:sortase A
VATPTVTRPPATAGKPTTAMRPIRPGESSEVVFLVSSACTVVAVICCWVLLQVLVLGKVSEARDQHLLYSRYRTELATQTAPTGALDYNGKPVAEGSPVALLTIPALGLQAVVVDGTTSGDLMSGPGHLRTTPMPGSVGVSLVMGRSTTYGAPFAGIASLHAGDTVQVLGAQGRVTYTVRDVRRAGDPIPALPPGAHGGRLILATAGSSGPMAALRPSEVVYVDADTSEAFPTGPAYPSVPAAERAMQNDTTAWPLLALFLALLAGVVLVASMARRLIRPAVIWLVATPVAIALAWAATDQVVRLLPNLM